MTVSELIAKLQKMPPTSEVVAFYDSAPRLQIDAVFNGKYDEDFGKEIVILADALDEEWFRKEFEHDPNTSTKPDSQ